MVIDAAGTQVNHFILVNLNKEKIMGGAIVLIAWVIALSLIFLSVQKFKLLLPK
jgi:hypothetical protein